MDSPPPPPPPLACAPRPPEMPPSPPPPLPQLALACSRPPTQMPTMHVLPPQVPQQPPARPNIVPNWPPLACARPPPQRPQQPPQPPPMRLACAPPRPMPLGCAPVAHPRPPPVRQLYTPLSLKQLAGHCVATNKLSSSRLPADVLPFVKPCGKQLYTRVPCSSVPEKDWQVGGFTEKPAPESKRVPFSVELSEGVSRYHWCLTKVDLSAWLGDVKQAEYSLKRYVKFLRLQADLNRAAASPSALRLTPPLDVKAIWLSHVIRDSYQADCKEICAGSVLDCHLFDPRWSPDRTSSIAQWDERYGAGDYLLLTPQLAQQAAKNPPVESKAVVSFFYSAPPVAKPAPPPELPQSFRMQPCEVVKDRQWYRLFENEAPGVNFSDPEALLQARVEYERFLYLNAKHPQKCLSPLTPADMFWHVHMSQVSAYIADCQRLVGQKFLVHEPWPAVPNTIPLVNETYCKEFPGVPGVTTPWERLRGRHCAPAANLNLSGEWRVYFRDTAGAERSYELTLKHDLVSGVISGGGNVASMKAAYEVRNATLEGRVLRYTEHWTPKEFGEDKVEALLNPRGTKFICKTTNSVISVGKRLDAIERSGRRNSCCAKYFLPYN